MKSYGICPASCGEFVQGFTDKREYLSSYAIDKYSKVTLEENKENINKGPEKSRSALKKVFKHFGLDKNLTHNISIKIESDIPVGKGMASSTADIGATIVAALKLIDKELNEYEISKLASSIEPTDSIYIPKNNIFDPLNGEVIKILGNIENAKVLILEPKERLNTSKIRKTRNYKDLKLENKEIIASSFELLEEGLIKKDLSLIGQAANMSSLVNENIHKKEYLKKIMHIANDFGAYGVNIAHSGTVIGILLDKEMNHEKLKQNLIDYSIDKKYEKIYCSNIIQGGVRSEL